MFLIFTISFAIVLILSMLYCVVMLKWLGIPFAVIIGYLGYGTIRFMLALAYN
jgi:hypothetical protein